MNIRRLIPVAGALLLVASALGGAALAESGTEDGPSSSNYETWCEENTDSEAEEEQCKERFEKQYNDSDDGPTWDGSQERSGDDWSSGDDDADRRSPHTPKPVVMEIPSDVAPDVDERREFYREQAREHREFHQGQQEERRSLVENQTAERRTFLQNLTQECLNATASEDVTAEDVRERLEADGGNATEECIKDLRAFLMEQQEERQDLFEEQRSAHEAFHEKQQREREEFLAEQRQEAEARADRGRQDWSRQQGPQGPDAAERPDPARPFGAFQASDGQVDGRYVSFNYTADPAALADVSVKGVPLFDAAALDGSAAHQFRGAAFALSGDNGSLVIHDNPAVAFQIQPEDDTTWVLNLAHHLTVNATDEEERWLVTDGRDLHGVLLFEDDPGYDDVNKSFTGDEGVRFVVVPEEVHDAGADDGGQMGSASEEAEISNAKRDALAKGTLGAEVNLASGDNGSVEDQTVIYDDLEVTLEEKEQGKVRFVVDGELETGRTVVVNADPGLFEGERLSISYHDIYENGTEEEVPIRLASTVQDVMDPNDDSTPEYLPAEGAQGWQVMVSIPHFSAHAVTIQSVTSQAPPSVMAGALAAVGFLVFAGANLFRRSGPRT